MFRPRSQILLFLGTLFLISLLALFGPEDQNLGSNVRIVYLHGAWVLTAEVAFAIAALIGLIGLITRHMIFHAWSAAVGRTGTFFWITYLPLSLWAMEANWNGLFLAEPRFRVAVTFAVVGLLLQIGLWMVNLPWLISAANLGFFIALRVVLAVAQYVMHPPPSPIFSSGDWQIIGFFMALNLLTLLAAYWTTGLFFQFAGKQSSVQPHNKS